MGTAPSPTPAYLEAWAAPVHSGAQPWQWGASCGARKPAAGHPPNGDARDFNRHALTSRALSNQPRAPPNRPGVGASSERRGGGARNTGGYNTGGADSETDPAYSVSGVTGRNGWVKPDAASFKDNGPPAEPSRAGSFLR